MLDRVTGLRNALTYSAVTTLLLFLSLSLQYAQAQTSPRTAGNRASLGTSGYLLLSDGTMHPGKPPKDEFYVRGRIIAEHQFEPSSGVEGHGTVCDNINDSPGYRALLTGEYQSKQAGQPVPYPVVEGCKRGNKFLPTKGEQPAIDWGPNGPPS